VDRSEVGWVQTSQDELSEGKSPVVCLLRWHALQPEP
jgi:hypothetical protein